MTDGSSAGDRIDVAVIDDHQVVVESLEAVLTRVSDIRMVGSALTIEDGIELVRRRQPDVVVLDFHLRDGTALDAIPRLLTAAPATRVIVLTALAADRVLARCLRAGAVGFVGKHQSVNDVITAIRAAAAGHASVSGEALASALPELVNARRHAAAAGLTAREHEVLALLAQGRANREIAASLHLSVNTVRNHVAAILMKVGASSRTEAVAIAHRDDLLDPPDQC